MVALGGFFSGGAADEIARGRALDVQEGQLEQGSEKLDILRGELSEKASQRKIKFVSDQLVKNNDIIQGLSALAQKTGAKEPLELARKVQIQNRVLKASLEGGVPGVDLGETGERAQMLLGAAGGPKALEAGAVTGAQQAQTIRPVKSFTPEGLEKTQLFQGAKPVAEVGTGPRTEVQTDRPPGAKNKDFQEVEAAEIGLRNVVQGVFDLKDIIAKGGPAALGTAGDVSLGIENLQSTVVGLADTFIGVDTSKFEDGKSAINKDEKAEGVFQRMKIAGTLNAQIKSDITNLAFAAAAASGQTGKGVSDKDFERFVKELGVGAKNPDTFTAVLDRFVQRIDRNFQNVFRVKARRITGLDASNPPQILKELSAGRAGPPKSVGDMSDADLKRSLGLR